jgi:hypothetical protein
MSPNKCHSLSFHFFFLSLFLSTLYFAIPLATGTSLLPSFAVSRPLCFFYPSIPALISGERFLAPYNPSFGISLTRSLLNLYTSRTCINIMLLLNLSCVFTRMPRCGCRHSCRLDLLCNPSLCVGSTYMEISRGNDLQKMLCAPNGCLRCGLRVEQTCMTMRSTSAPTGAKETHYRIYHA